MPVIKHVLILSALVLPFSATAVSPQHDEYYSDDIFTAIEEAKQRTHHYNYSRSKRYNRSTSQSIQIPRLLNTEMDEHVVEGAIGSTASGTKQQEIVDGKVQQANLGRNQKDESNETVATTSADTLKVIPEGGPTVIREISYNGQDFVGTARNISAEVSISATARP